MGVDVDTIEPHPSVEEEKAAILDEFALLGDWMQRYEYIIEMGKKLDGLPDARKDDAHKVPGCQSQVWFYARRDGGRIVFDADSDAIIVRGLIALLLRLYSGRTPQEILATSPEFFAELELGSHLSGSRANGLHAMIKRIQAYAQAYKDAGEAAEIEPEKLN